MVRCLTIIVAIWSVICFAGTTLDYKLDKDHQKYAKLFSGVGVLRGVVMDDRTKIVDGTAIAIHDHWILTAAHCVMYSKKEDLVFSINDKLYDIDMVFIGKDFDGSSASSIGDIALCRVRLNMDLNKYHQIYEGCDEKGKYCSISGYGVFGDCFSFKRNKDYKLRAGSNIVEDIKNDKLITNISILFPTKLEYLISRGDSGGPLFIDDKIAGIHSFVSGPFEESTVGTYGFHTRVSHYSEWIKKIIDQNSCFIPQIKARKKPWYEFW